MPRRAFRHERIRPRTTAIRSDPAASRKILPGPASRSGLPLHLPVASVRYRTPVDPPSPGLRIRLAGARFMRRLTGACFMHR